MELDPGSKKGNRRKGRHASSSSLGARPAIARSISAHPTIRGVVCVWTCYAILTLDSGGWEVSFAPKVAE